MPHCKVVGLYFREPRYLAASRASELLRSAWTNASGRGMPYPVDKPRSQSSTIRLARFLHLVVRFVHLRLRNYESEVVVMPRQRVASPVSFISSSCPSSSSSPCRC